MKLKKRDMYLIIFFIAFIHWLLAIIWFIFNKVNIESRFTKDFKEYQSCSYPLSKNLRLVHLN